MGDRIGKFCAARGPFNGSHPHGGGEGRTQRAETFGRSLRSVSQALKDGSDVENAGVTSTVFMGRTMGRGLLERRSRTPRPSPIPTAGCSRSVRERTHPGVTL